MLFNRSSWTERIVRSFATLPVEGVAVYSLMAGMFCSALESSGRIDWGHESLLLAIVPIVAWAVARWWVDRE